VRTTTGGQTIADAFVPTDNSLNFLRIVLAVTVMVSHSILIGGYANESFLNTNFSTIALYGFFGLSGFLIAGSAARNSVGRYLWQRVLRIFPAFLICLIVTAFVIAGLAWVFGGQGITSSTHHCGYSCFVGKPDGPFAYVWHNSALKINQQLIAGTPRNVPFGYVWNGPLWSLFYEFICYLVLAALAAAGLLRRRPVVLALTVAAWALEFLASFGYNKQLLSLDPAIFMWGHIAVLVPLFLTGSVLYLYRDLTPNSGWIALGSTALFTASLWWPFNLPTNRFTGQIGGAALWSPALVYPLIWLGCHLPLQRVGSRNDYSYGIYIYAWPVQELLVMWHFQRFGYPAYTLISVMITLPLAVASWWLIEKRALSLKKVDPGVAFMRLVRTKGE
jgi:peptidoglycan/LPS O-acetylase OafA/YrhL